MAKLEVETSRALELAERLDRFVVERYDGSWAAFRQRDKYGFDRKTTERWHDPDTPTPPSTAALMLIAKEDGLDLNWLLLGEGTMYRAKPGTDTSGIPARVRELLVAEFVRSRRVSRAVIEECFTDTGTLWSAISAMASQMVDSALALRRDPHMDRVHARRIIDHEWRRRLKRRRISEDLADITNMLAFMEEHGGPVRPRRKRRRKT